MAGHCPVLFRPALAGAVRRSYPVELISLTTSFRVKLLTIIQCVQKGKEMRYYPGKDLEESHRSTLDEHPHGKRAVQEQIKRSRAQIAASEELLRRPAVGGSDPL